MGCRRPSLSPGWAAAGGLAAVAVALLFPAPARAYEEQATLGVMLSYAALPMAPEGAPAHGLGGGLRTTYGLGDTWSLEARLEHAFLPQELAPTHLTRLAIGATYAIDILKVVPFLGFGLGGALGVRDGDVSPDLLLYAAVGLDYLVSRRFLVGFDVRLEALPFRNIAPVDLLVVTGGIRFSWVFDLF